MKLGLFLFAEYINMFVSSAIIATIYFGGYNLPLIGRFITDPNTLAVVGFLVFFVKILFFIFLYMWVRWTLPRFRYDQLMHLGWKSLIPIAIINLLVTAGFLILKEY